MTVHVGTLDELAPATLYALLRLRVDVFVVEQHCPYPELDGRDTEPATRHLWITDEAPQRPGDPSGPNGPDDPVAYLRILSDPGGVARIGRVVVAAHARGAGHAARLLRATLDLVGDRTCVLEAQSYLTGFYGQFGFIPTGPEYDEDGIPHVPMRRPTDHGAGHGDRAGHGDGAEGNVRERAVGAATAAP